MDKFATLEPLRLYATNSTPKKPIPKLVQLVGRLPADLHLLVLSYLPIPDFPAYSRCSRAAAALSESEKVWEARWKALEIDKHQLGSVLDDLEQHNREQAGASRVAAPPTLSVDDEFGDFASGDVLSNAPSAEEMGDFVGAFDHIAVTPTTATTTSKSTKASTFRGMFIRAHNLLKQFTKILESPPHVILNDLASAVTPSLRSEALALRLLSSYLSVHVQPLRKWSMLHTTLRSAMDRFDANLLTAFDQADSKADEAGMKEAAESSWLVWDGSGDWEMGKVWTEKREIFYEQNWDPMDNFTKDGQGLDFDAMHNFMDVVLAAIKDHGSRAVRIFPKDSGVLLFFADRVATEVVGEYITSLLTRAREISPNVFLQASAATFGEVWRMADVILEASKAAGPDKDTEGVVTQTQAEDVVYRMFEVNMDEYLDEEIENVKRAFEAICKGWEHQAAETDALASAERTRFLTSQNPAQVKRNVLASFTDVLLLPVTIVPRTVNAVGGALVTGVVTGGTAAVQGIAMLNPARWTGAGAGQDEWKEYESRGYQVYGQGLTEKSNGRSDRSGKDLREQRGDGEMVFEIGEEEDEEEDFVGGGLNEKNEWEKAREEQDEAGWGNGDKTSVNTRSSVNSSISQLDIKSAAESSITSGNSIKSTRSSVPTPLPSSAANTLDKMDLLLSLDIALELIHTSRESLKRVETFSGYPGHYGFRVRDTIEELFVLMLKALSEGHVEKGFREATQRMTSYKPAEHEEMTSVAPLLQFFELVHIGDMIQSMVQVYFDKEMAHHIDKTDFLNSVVREKKRFENTLDDSVAAGLNAGTDLLMNQVDHIIQRLTKPREYYPPENVDLELGPTDGCKEAIRCLEVHCKLLKGSTSKEVLEVFHQEVGIRLIAILQKHIKRQIISLKGGFQIIADLNAYHAFITSLKVPQIASDFSHLKMLGHVYVVEDAKDLAQIVRDVTRYGGAYRPEDIYEFIQRRSDWKKIEKTVDKTMYNLSFKEDCTIC
ncbi:hypothetical protein K435DRAFT_836576 [Dendrothele bispora CBS 962.96]|uniref:F-box domain-containing protein n=1 Tax=Dendrothele bispora (strain CBS 962.96) TaxID=1314807 RepID=A0A4S8MI39_DENBC|nr:hypothetical protein K435DRAFT_836576 [Dendrothele bispora CBS 962.96]